MLNRIERHIFFAILCVITVGAFTLEGFLIYSFVDKEPGIAQALFAVVNTGILYAVARQFIEISRKTFLQRSPTSVDRLQQFASERCGVLKAEQRASRDPYLGRQLLVTNTLKFAEQCVRGWLRGSHFELCVFVDAEQPLLFSYFDSNHDVIARSMGDRERNPLFYVQKGYEVTKLLQNPTSQPRILQDTYDEKARYAFTSEQQRKQLRSSALLCLDLENPCALVISSNEKNAFSEADAEVMSFIRLVGELVSFDLLEGRFIYEIRKMKPNLFAGNRG